MDGMSDVIFCGWENVPLKSPKKSDWIDDLLLFDVFFFIIYETYCIRLCGNILQKMTSWISQATPKVWSLKGSWLLRSNSNMTCLISVHFKWVCFQKTMKHVVHLINPQDKMHYLFFKLLVEAPNEYCSQHLWIIVTNWDVPLQRNVAVVSMLWALQLKFTVIEVSMAKILKTWVIKQNGPLGSILRLDMIIDH